MTLFRAGLSAALLFVALPLAGLASAQAPAAKPPAATPSADAGCVGNLDARIKAVRADSALTPGEQQERVDAIWTACSGQVRNAVSGATQLAVVAGVEAAIDIDPLKSSDPEAASRRAHAAVAGIDTQDPDQRTTQALVGAYAAEEDDQ